MCLFSNLIIMRLELCILCFKREVWNKKKQCKAQIQKYYIEDPMR